MYKNNYEICQKLFKTLFYMQKYISASIKFKNNPKNLLKLQQTLCDQTKKSVCIFTNITLKIFYGFVKLYATGTLKKKSTVK